MTQVQDRRARWHGVTRQFVIFLGFLLIAVIVTFPLILNMNSVLIGGDTSDAYEMARNSWWINYALENGEPLIHQTLLGYPDGFAGITIWGHWLQFLPTSFLNFFLPLPVAYNLVILLNMALNGWAMQWLVFDLTKRKSLAPALIAGLIYMTFPTFQGHLFESHVGLIAGWQYPLYLFVLLKWVNTSQKRWLFLTVVFFFLSASGHTLQLIYVILPITLTVLIWQAWKRNWGNVGRIVIAGLASSLVYLIFLIPILEATLSTGTYSDVGGSVRYSVDLLGIISPSFLHPLFGELLEYPRQVLGVNLGEGLAYIGIMAAILSIFGLIFKRESRWFLLLALLAWILSLGPVLKIFDQPVLIEIGGYDSIIPLPWGLLENLPIFNLARTPGRFAFALGFAVSIMAGYGMSALWERYVKTSVWRGVIFALISIGVVFEYQSFWGFPTMTADIPDSIVELRDRDDVRAVFNVPWDNLLIAKDALYLQVAHQKPMIAGQVTRQTPVNPAKLNILQETLDPYLFDQSGVDVIIYHKGRAHDPEFDAHIRSIGEPYYEDERIALFIVPDTTSEATEFVSIVRDEKDITTSTDILSLYVEEPSWIDLEGTLSANDRSVTILLDDIPFQTWRVESSSNIAATIPIQSGYHTLSLSLNPPCPQLTNEILRCEAVVIESWDAEIAYPLTSQDSIQFDEGVQLNAWDTTIDDELNIRLWWQFNQGRSSSDVRFIHVLDEDGELVLQDDLGFGDLDAGHHWSEVITLPTGELPSGEYLVFTGWYSYPDLQRLAIVSDVETDDLTLEIGSFSLP